MKSLKLFKENCVSKIVAQDQGKAKRLKITNSGTEDLAQCISKYNLELKSDLIAIYRDPDDTTLIKKAIRSLLDFNQSCRRLRIKNAAVRGSTTLSRGTMVLASRFVLSL